MDDFQREITLHRPAGMLAARLRYLILEFMRSHTSLVQRPRHSGSLRDGRVTLTREVAAGVSISMPAAAAFTIITQPALLTDFSEAAAPAPDGVTVWGGRMADGTLNRFGAESAGGIEAEVD